MRWLCMISTSISSGELVPSQGRFQLEKETLMNIESFLFNFNCI